jgi:1,2-diacylglycerol 3-beta-glucosyltransferase
LLKATGAGGSALRAAAFILVNRTRPAGRAVLGQSAMLVGNCTLFSRELLLERPWEAFTSTEDLEYALDLQVHGFKIAFAGWAVVTSETAPTIESAAVQQRRWEGGRLHLLRARGPGLVAEAVRRRRPGLLLTALDLATPPLGLFAGVAVVGGVTAAGVAVAGGPAWSVAPWLLAAGALPLYVGIGLRAGHAPRAAYRALGEAPLFIIRKPWQMRGVLGFQPDSWVRTQRRHEVGELAGDAPDPG